MAKPKITFANKSDISTTSTPAANKVVASDMNEVKTTVNQISDNVGDVSNLTTTNKTVVPAINELRGTVEPYSTNEVATRKRWTDNSVIWRRVIKSNGNTGTSINIAHGISNLKVVIDYSIVATNENGTTYLSGNTIYPIFIEDVDTTNVVATINNAFQAGWTIYIILEYTKGV